MTGDATNLKDDISFLRSLAEAGRDRPIGSGLMLVGAGTIFGTAALLSWLEWTGLVRPLFPVEWIWLGATLAALAGSAICIRFLRARRELLGGPSNLAFSMAWQSAGVGILVLLVVNFINMWRLQNPLVLTAQASTYICLYGVAWYASAALTKHAWFYGVAVLCFGFAVIFALLPYGPPQMLAFAISMICTALVPGIYLTIKEPRLT